MSTKGVIKYNEFNIANLRFGKLEDNARVKSQKIAYIKYMLDSAEGQTEVQFKLQTPEIKTETYGIPREGPYYPDAKSRSFYKFPFCFDRKQFPTEVNYEAVEHLYNVFCEIDAYCGSEEFKKECFGDKNASQYAYQPLVRVPEEDDDEEAEQKVDKNGNPYYRPPFTKVKLELEYSPDQDNQSTKPNFTILERVDNKREKVELNSFDDVLKYIRFNSNLRFIINFSKLYAMKTKSGTEKKKYGIVIKATHIEAKRQANKSNVQYDADPFCDSDTDDAITQNVVQISRGVSNLDVDTNDNDESEDVVEEVVAKSVKTEVKDSKSSKKVDPVEEAAAEDDTEEIVEERPKAKTSKPKSSATSKKATR